MTTMPTYEILDLTEITPKDTRQAYFTSAADLYVFDDYPDEADLYQENSISSSRSLIESYLRTSITLVAVEKEKMLGFILLCKGREYDTSEAMIMQLLVAKAHRGQGIGKELLHSAEQKAITIGYTLMYLYSTLDSTLSPKHKFYTDMGYAPEAGESSLAQQSCHMIKALNR